MSRSAHRHQGKPWVSRGRAGVQQLFLRPVSQTGDWGLLAVADGRLGAVAGVARNIKCHPGELGRHDRRAFRAMTACQATKPRRAAATAAVWPGIVLARRWRSSAVVRFISRRGKRRPKNFITLSTGLETARLRVMEWGRSFAAAHIVPGRTRLNRKSEPFDLECDIAGRVRPG